MINLEKIKLGYSPLSDEIYLFRHGKNKTEALDKRLAERDVMEVITLKMMEDSENGASIDYHFGNQWYRLTVEKIEKREKNDTE